MVKGKINTVVAGVALVNKQRMLTGDHSIGARVLATSLSPTTQPQAEDTQRKPESAADRADHGADEPRLTHHAELHATHRIRTCSHVTRTDCTQSPHHIQITSSSLTMSVVQVNGTETDSTEVTQLRTTLASYP